MILTFTAIFILVMGLSVLFLARYFQNPTNLRTFSQKYLTWYFGTPAPEYVLSAMTLSNRRFYFILYFLAGIILIGAIILFSLI